MERTKEERTLIVLNNYKEKISSIINKPVDHIKIYCKSKRINQKYEEIGIIDWEKKEEWGSDYISNFSLGNYIILVGHTLPETFKYSYASYNLTDGELPNNPERFNYKCVWLSSFKLYQLQHCCAVMVSCDAEIYEYYRGKGLGIVLNRLRQDIGRLMGYTIIMCTDVIDNKPQRKILEKENWKDVYTFTNKRTKNKLALTLKEL